MPFDALRRIFRFSIIPLALFEALWGGGVTEFSCTALGQVSRRFALSQAPVFLPTFAS